MKKIKKLGLTIAEVLIALGVVGILTIILITGVKSYNVAQWQKTNDYKTGIIKYDKVYNAINQSFTNQALKNTNFFKNDKAGALTNAFNTLNSTCSGGSCNFANYPTANENNFKRQLADGTQLSVQSFAENNGNSLHNELNNLSYIIYVDTNGNAKPNTIEQDRLPIYIDSNGNVINVNPKTGKTYSSEAQKKYNGKTYQTSCGAKEIGYKVMTKNDKTGQYEVTENHCRPKDCTPHGDPYEISTTEDLEYIKTHLSCNYILKEDIDLSEVSNWEVSGTFDGNFDGDNHIIENLKTHKGLFSTIKNSTVKNLVLKNVTINNTSQANIGGLTGKAENTTIENVSVLDLNISSSQNNVGGLVGVLQNSTVKQSSASGTVSASGKENIGGLIGKSTGKTINASSFSGTVTGKINIGGIAGNIANTTVQDSSAIGAVTASGGESVGGAIGASSGSSNISNSSFKGEVSGSTRIGGFIGLLDTSTSYTISNCTSNVTKVTGTYNVGGFVGSLRNGKIQNSNVTGGTVSGSNGTGGFCGQLSHPDLSTTPVINNCETHANCNGVIVTGGFVGYHNKGSITSSKAHGDIYSKGWLSESTRDCCKSGVAEGDYAGGFVGEIFGGSISNSYAYGNVTGTFCTFGKFAGLKSSSGGTISNSTGSGNVYHRTKKLSNPAANGNNYYPTCGSEPSGCSKDSLIDAFLSHENLSSSYKSQINTTNTGFTFNDTTHSRKYTGSFDFNKCMVSWTWTCSGLAINSNEVKKMFNETFGISATNIKVLRDSLYYEQVPYTYSAKYNSSNCSFTCAMRGNYYYSKYRGWKNQIGTNHGYYGCVY